MTNKDIVESIEKEIDRIKKMTTSLKKDDNVEFLKVLSGIHCNVCHLENYISEQIKEQRIGTAKKAIEYLLSNGFSFQDVNIDGVSFEINGKEIIQRRYGCLPPYEESDIPF